MSEIASLIAGSEQLTAIFGRWPSFHDAEVLELHLERGINAEAKGPDSPCFTVKIHLWLMTDDVDQKGYYVLARHTLATLKFYGVEDFKMEGFNQQNVIFGLGIEQKTHGEGASPFFAVNFDPSFGVDASFTCVRVEVVEAVACDAEGRVGIGE